MPRVNFPWCQVRREGFYLQVLNVDILNLLGVRRFVRGVR